MMLYGVDPHDRLTFMVVPALLISVAAVASLIPARAMVSTDPLALLRHE